MIKETPVCIIGAGPGGVCAALRLTQLGLSCTVVEKAVFPRDKVGGDVLPGIILRALHELDPSYVQELLDADFVVEIAGTKLYAPNNSHLTIDYRALDLAEHQQIPSCYASERRLLDDYLLDKVRGNASIELIEGQAIDHADKTADGWLLSDKKGNFQIKAKMVLVASGANATIAQKISGNVRTPKHRGVGVRAYYENVDWGGDKRYAELFFLKDLFPGILYMTPLANGVTNINLGSREDVIKRKNLNLKKILNQAIEEHPILKERFANAKLINAAKGWSLPFATKKETIYGDNFLLIGDAASLIDFTSGNGIGSSMFSGIFAANKTAEAFEANDFSADFLANYQIRVEKKLGNHLRLGRMVAPFFGFTFLYGFYQWITNQIIKRTGNSEFLTQLMYSKDIEKDMFAWMFKRNKKQPKKEVRQEAMASSS